MKLCKAKRICFSIHYSEGKALKWKKRTIAKMEKHRRRYNYLHDYSRPPTGLSGGFRFIEDPR